MFGNWPAEPESGPRASARSPRAVAQAARPTIRPAAATVRIKDIVDIEGVRDNMLVGYGLVVGLQGTGDSMKNG